MSTTKFDIITRSAIWASYSNICFYCSRPLDWNDLNIDHIIPENLSTDPARFEKIKDEYELRKDYYLNNFYNLVPSHSKCNFRKSGNLFDKTTTLFYLSLTKKKVKTIDKEIQKLTQRKNKGQIISKLQAALSAKLIDPKEVDAILLKAKMDNWKSAKIKLPIGVEFIDEIYDSFYLDTDCSSLYDKKLLLGKTFESLELVDDNGSEIVVSTLREWQNAIKQGYYPLTTFAIKMSDSFTFLDEFLQALHSAKMPRISFINDPWIDLNSLDNLSPNIIHDFEGKSREFAKAGFSVGELVRQGIIKRNKTELFQIGLEFYGTETLLSEQFRADFNNDGIEDIFVRGWTRAVGGTMGYGFTVILTKVSNTAFLDEISNANTA